MSLGDWEEGKRKRARNDGNSTTQLPSFFFFFPIIYFLLEYPAGGSMEKRATVTLKLSDFTIK